MFDPAAVSTDNIIPDPCQKRRRAPPFEPSAAGAAYSAFTDKCGNATDLEQHAAGWCDDIIVFLFRARRGTGSQLWLTGSSPSLDALALSDRTRMKASMLLSDVFQPVETPDIKQEAGCSEGPDQQHWQLDIPCDAIPCVLRGARPGQIFNVIVSISPNGRGIALPVDASCREQLVWEHTAEGGSESDSGSESGSGCESSSDDASSDLDEFVCDSASSDSDDSSDSEGADTAASDIEDGGETCCCAEHAHLRRFVEAVADKQARGVISTNELHSMYVDWDDAAEKIPAATSCAFGRVLGRHTSLFMKAGSRAIQRRWKVRLENGSHVRACSCCRDR